MTTDIERHIQLSWLLLEHKFLYYVKDKPIIQDYEYDMLEKEYDALCEKLNLPKTVSDMVGFDEKRHSCQAVMTKFRHYNG